jgi:hypothetical protein
MATGSRSRAPSAPSTPSCRGYRAGSMPTPDRWHCHHPWRSGRRRRRRSRSRRGCSGRTAASCAVQGGLHQRATARDNHGELEVVGGQEEHREGNRRNSCLEHPATPAERLRQLGAHDLFDCCRSNASGDLASAHCLVLVVLFAHLVSTAGRSAGCRSSGHRREHRSDPRLGWRGRGRCQQCDADPATAR